MIDDKPEDAAAPGPYWPSGSRAPVLDELRPRRRPPHRGAGAAPVAVDRVGPRWTSGEFVRAYHAMVSAGHLLVSWGLGATPSPRRAVIPVPRAACTRTRSFRPEKLLLPVRRITASRASPRLDGPGGRGAGGSEPRATAARSRRCGWRSSRSRAK